MCRLLGVVSRGPIALDRAVGEEIEPFTAQSEVHRDGWGVAWFDDEDGRERQDRQGEPGGSGDADARADPESGADHGGSADHGSSADHGGSADHCGRGARLANPRRPQTRRHLDVARESAAYREAIAAARGPMMLVHLRRASPGLPMEIANTHPFREGETVFAHNGQFDLSAPLREAILARGGRTPEGTTDSELFYSLITLHQREHDLAAAVQHAAAELTALCLHHGARVPEALNCLVMTPDLMVAYQQHDPAQAARHQVADMYALRYRIDADRVIVASTGIPQTGHLEVGEGQALVIERSDLSVAVRPALEETGR
ncbi:class II glutamine amidotransferase [Brachybacterium sacelli]|uniref:Glutamine amidotransferase n=1 Tax=Brachybacterium sacelli TaxID=173364 RepID=A0ABS4WW90_9MICO|nr:class II glutamine amidotransferase [Brachybacterium sacelli]MBP2380462.1 putative glutamine amidotransferase [Brachybacterium sacelli]